MSEDSLALLLQRAKESQTEVALRAVQAALRNATLSLPVRPEEEGDAVFSRVICDRRGQSVQAVYAFTSPDTLLNWRPSQTAIRLASTAEISAMLARHPSVRVRIDEGTPHAVCIDQTLLPHGAPAQRRLIVGPCDRGMVTPCEQWDMTEEDLNDLRHQLAQVPGLFCAVQCQLWTDDTAEPVRALGLVTDPRVPTSANLHLAVASRVPRATGLTLYTLTDAEWAALLETGASPIFMTSSDSARSSATPSTRTRRGRRRWPRAWWAR